MLGGIIIHEYTFLLLMLIIHTGCLWEYTNLISAMQDYTQRQRRIVKYYNLISGTLIFYLLATGFHFLPFVNDYIYFLVTPLLLGYFIVELFMVSTSPLRNAAVNAAGVLYISFPLSMAIFFSVAKETGEWFPVRCGLILGLILLVWTNDTMAYFAGSLFGKHKMLERISPKKTWEGFFGGLLFSVIVGGILSQFFDQLQTVGWMILGAIVAVFGTIGDFVESMIKRSAGVKDSGNILPGHGGFLDRFDAFIFCIPFVFMFYMTMLLLRY